MYERATEVLATLPSRRASPRLGMTLVLVLLIVLWASTPGIAQQQTRTTSAHPTAPTQRAVLSVSGMYCASCARMVTAMLTHTPGVVSAAVSAAPHQAVVVFDARRTSPAALAQVIDKLGYHARPTRS